MSINDFINSLSNKLIKNNFHYIKINKEYNNLDKTLLLHIRCKRNKKNYTHDISIHENWLNNNSINVIIGFLLLQ